MTTTLTQQNKTTVWAFWQELSATPADQLRPVVAAHVQGGAYFDFRFVKGPLAKALGKGDTLEAIDKKEQKAKQELLELVEEREATCRAARVVDLVSSPSCYPDRLSSPPHVRRDIEGLLRLELHGIDGWSDEGVIEEVSRLERYGLVLVATDSQSFLMTAEDFDTPAE